ncbi:outer membrane protein TolC [Anseongella ginsenosidimutans]|uniref:Outer membrane protein TolC n=1 Tax=Anseongella ginsenosidimutans TaxID=496056 RepID=A0A4R3KPL2_9SPHI|nr:TolC family protein [Anseongella ginsenosidimutans]QEC53642.1 TolC family protein [Anseongella ginsenosidimutans]TCS86110.1 outer membrane protein TolC [Anseongella ginsenosidimutans]
MKNKLLITGLLLFSLNAARAQDTTDALRFNLEECIDYAFEHQYTVKNAELDVELAESEVKETIGQGLPQVNGNVNFQDYLKLPTQLIPGEFFGGEPGTYIPVQFGTQYSLTYGLEATQLLFDGSYFVGLKASQVYKDLSIKSLKRSRIETAIAVSKAYYSVLVTEEQLQLADVNIARIKKQLDETQALYKNGFAEKIDADRLQVLYNNSLTEKESLTRMAALNIHMLKFQMGMPISGQLVLKESIEDVQFEPVLLLNEDIDPANRIEYSLLQTQESLNELDLKRYKTTMLPRIEAFGSYNRNGQENDFGNLFNGDGQYFPTTVVGLRISIPLIGGGQKWQQVKQAKLNLLKTQNELYNLENAISLEVRQATTTYTNSVESMENQERNMELAEEVYRVSRIKYSQGVGSSLEVTTAETSLKEAQTNYINSLYDALIAKIDLQKAKGTIETE